ncbi:MAG: hypothetical protein A2Z21_05345 [Candidatus Fraserbacteria bacterium RBG_16_55_9]|uniref:Rhodanese domain-containing protein n=1 Tax=Fraserbacteria sp. (strain RBG_16_55_9) TaxID=1817864 RepID=A0A1F5UWD7_FRAXR|nr:MAG: hypothetical protein A2Z21_05345 [Candidatus Fraserbacteria bacterium RBG_16_55_9]
MSSKQKRKATSWAVGVVGLVVVAGVALGVWFILTNRATDPPLGDVSVRQAKDLIQGHHDDPNFVVLDVRTPQEYDQGHISGEGITPVNLDFYAADFREQLAKLDRVKTYLVYCRTGNRSAKTVDLMKELGFRGIYNLEGGITAWQEAGQPLK